MYVVRIQLGKYKYFIQYSGILPAKTHIENKLFANVKSDFIFVKAYVHDASLRGG